MLAKLRSLLAKFVAKEVSFRAGKIGLNIENFLIEMLECKLGGNSYSKMPETLELSKVPCPVTYGLAVMKNVAFGYRGLLLRSTFVVCPGAIRIVSVSKGLI